MASNSNAQNHTPFDLLSHYIELASEAEQEALAVVAETTHYLLFTAAGEGFMIDIDNVDSIIRDQPLIKALPFSPIWLKGLCSIRNEIVSVISFAALWQDKQTSTVNKNYILLRGEKKGFMLEVGDLAGIKEVDVEEDRSDKGFVDGHCKAEGKTWQRINIDALLASGLAQAGRDF